VAPLREQTHTADASSTVPAINAVVSDATPSAARAQAFNDTSNAEAKPDAPKSELATDAADTSENKPGDLKADTNSGTKSDAVNAETPTAAIGNVETAKPDAPMAEEVKTSESRTSESKITESKAAEKPAEPVKAATDVPAAPAVDPDVKKDTTRLPGAEKAAKAEPPRRPGQIAVFVSRKDSKLYVRENFKPQFDVPVTIAASDRPLGTHVFTVQADKNDPNQLRWSVVSLPVTVRHAVRTDEDDRSTRGRKMAGGAEAKPSLMPNNPAEALDRITVAPEAIARIAEALTTGGSIIVSDHGINQGGETGEGTDFIVPLR
jgi:hypothetical protein